MKQETREVFDAELDAVMADMPPRVHELLEKIPMIIEDYPSREVMRRMRVRRRSSLCGLYTGVPLTKRSVDLSGIPSDVIHIYREGIMSMARRADGTFNLPKLRKQIRMTILHELGHHHGMTERDLREMGYG
jgi:predicted Zn-dependent protease with MMP-like domain